MIWKNASGTGQNHALSTCHFELQVLIQVHGVD